MYVPAEVHLFLPGITKNLLPKLVEAVAVASLSCDTVQVQRTQQLSAVRKTVEAEFERELADLTVLGVEAKLRAKLEAVQQLTAVLHKESSAALPSSPEVGTSSSALVAWVLMLQAEKIRILTAATSLQCHHLSTGCLLVLQAEKIRKFTAAT